MVARRSDGFVPPCIPTPAHTPPAGPDWVHEIKHDGYRLQARRDGDAVRLFTRRGDIAMSTAARSEAVHAPNGSEASPGRPTTKNA
jgi:ATP-dependent DNA ligase